MLSLQAFYLLFKTLSAKTYCQLPVTTKLHSLWLKQTEYLAWRDWADGPVPQLDILLVELC